MKILVIGYRKALYQKLLANCEHVYVIDEKLPKKPNSYFYKLHPKDYENIEIIALKIKPDIVIASSEKSVLTAAKLRKKLNVFGESLGTAALCTNKLKMKKRASELNIPITRYQYIKKSTIRIEDIKDFNLPIVIKSLDESGGRNTEYIHDIETLKTRIIHNQLIESYISGYECSVETLVQNGEIKFTNITTYTKKYSQNILPSNLQPQIANQILAYNKKIIEGFEIKNSLCHSEFYINNNDITFGEIAIRPPGGYIMHLLELSYKTDFWQVYIDLHLGNDISSYLHTNPSAYSAVWIIHPGEGEITSITGWEQISQLKHYAGGKLKIKVGDICQKRIGSGQDYGYVFFTAKSPDVLIKQLETAERVLHIGIKNDLEFAATI